MCLIRKIVEKGIVHLKAHNKKIKQSGYCLNDNILTDYFACTLGVASIAAVFSAFVSIMRIGLNFCRQTSDFCI